MIMRLRPTFWILFSVLLCGNIGHVWAYEGGAGGSPASSLCQKVQFSEFNPPQFSQEKNNTEVPQKSEFSFLASKETFPESVAVTISGETVPIDVKPHYAGFEVTGKLPDDIKGTFVRIDITAQGPHRCERGDGWLLKVAE